MDTEVIVKLLGALGIGGAMGAIISGYFGNKNKQVDASVEDKKTDIDATDRLVGHWETMLKPLRDRIIFLEKDREVERDSKLRLIHEVASLKNKLMVFESSHFDLPLPMWMKDVKGRMIFMNDSCQELILEPLGLKIEDYLGKTDIEFWGKEYGSQFSRTDNKVLRSKKPLDAIHTILDSNKEETSVMVLKYPRFHGNEIIGVGGLIKYIIEDDVTNIRPL
jgi:hypothetical protein